MDLKLQDQELHKMYKVKEEIPGPQPGPEPTGSQPEEPGITGAERTPPEAAPEITGVAPDPGQAGAAAKDRADSTGPAAAADLDSLRAEVEKKTAALAELQQHYLRLQADFDNYRKRTRREQEELTRLAAARLITGLLPVVDNLERALVTAADGKGEGLAAGVEMTRRQLMAVLEQEGLAPVAAVGQPFDPELHEAVAREETDNPEQVNRVVAEFRRGYTLQGKLLRPAMVQVAVAGPSGEENRQGVDHDE